MIIISSSTVNTINNNDAISVYCEKHIKKAGEINAKNKAIPDKRYTQVNCVLFQSLTLGWDEESQKLALFSNPIGLIFKT